MNGTQGTTGVVASDNPAQSGDVVNENTLENLEANIVKQLNSLSDESTGDVETPAATTVPGDTPAAADTQVEKTEAEVAAEAKSQRLSQDNANLRGILMKMNIDPDSDTAEGLKSGLISFEDVIRTRTPVPATSPQATKNVAPQLSLDQKIANFQNKINQKGRNPSPADYAADMNEAAGLMVDLVQANQRVSQTLENNDLQNLLNETVTATTNVFSTDVKSVLPEDIRGIGQELFVGATDVAVGNLARTMVKNRVPKARERAFSAQGYATAAKDVASRFDTFVQGIVKATEAATVKAILKTNPNIKTNTPIVVNPITPGFAGGTPPPPENPDKYKIENLQSNVDEFMRGTQLQV